MNRFSDDFNRIFGSDNAAKNRQATKPAETQAGQHLHQPNAAQAARSGTNARPKN